MIVGGFMYTNKNILSPNNDDDFNTDTFEYVY
jgi:hypothetical protein